MGANADALDEYTAALKFHLAHRDWLLRIEMPSGIEPEMNPRVNVTWGTTARATTLGRYQPRYPTLTGRLDNSGVVMRGGVVAPPIYYTVYASEIVRCTALGHFAAANAAGTDQRVRPAHDSGGRGARPPGRRLHALVAVLDTA